MAIGTIVNPTTGVFQRAINDQGNEAVFVDIKSFGRTTVPGFSALTEDGYVLSCGHDSQGQTGVGDYPAAQVNFLKTIRFQP